jgi:hypothetical protein
VTLKGFHAANCAPMALHAPPKTAVVRAAAEVNAGLLLNGSLQKPRYAKSGTSELPAESQQKIISAFAKRVNADRWSRIK